MTPNMLVSEMGIDRISNFQRDKMLETSFLGHRGMRDKLVV